MPRRKAQSRTSTPFPTDAPVQRTIGLGSISDSDEDDAAWQLIASDIRNCIFAAQAARNDYENNLRTYNQIYELYSPTRNQPFQNSSNLFLPVAVAKLDTLMSQVAAKVFVPDVFIITGNTPEADAVSYDDQRWYNTEFRKERNDETTRLGECLDVLFYGLLEGVSILEVTWMDETELQLYDVEVPHLDGNDDPQFGDDGEFLTEYQEVEKLLQISEAKWRNCQIKDFLLVPNESRSIYQAAATARCVWLYEAEMRAMIESGLLSKKWVDKVVAFDPAGQSDVASDRQGYWDKTAGGQMQIGQGQGTLSSPQFRNRGPFKVWIYNSNQFDMNRDKIPERNNVFWWAELSNYLLGWKPSKNISARRGYVAFCPLPRKNSFYGFSFLERMAPINSEINTIVNNTNDFISLQLKPPMQGNSNYESRTDNYQWELGKIWWVEDVNNAFKQFTFQSDVPIGAFQQVAQLNAYGDQLAGISAPMTGGQTAGRKSATEIKASVQGSGVRSDLIALYLRFTLRRALQHTHDLNIQNMPETPPPGVYQPTREMLSQDLNLDVAGISEPLDMATYGSEVLSFYQLMSQDPDIQGDAKKRYFLKRTVAQILNIRNIDAILGTADEADQRKQSEDQANQVKTQLEMEMQKAEIASKLKGTAAEAQQAGGGAPGGPPPGGGDPGQGGDQGGGAPPDQGAPPGFGGMQPPPQ